MGFCRQYEAIRLGVVQHVVQDYRLEPLLSFNRGMWPSTFKS